MTTPAIVKSADLKRMADVAKAKGVTVWIEAPDGRKIGVSPDLDKIEKSRKNAEKEEIDF
ncbi:hypothetical protein [Allorhizobium undicola]|uniref:hypothetical protein n=1 Tax=Allorhizobium undicola TaxID=78527 RepID=UPI000488F5BF|nr:hypothetical protein [Allorhizobium undicola]